MTHEITDDISVVVSHSNAHAHY